MNSHEGKYPYQCEVCGKGTTNPIRMKEHLALHTGINYFACERCGQTFRFKRELEKHKQSCDQTAIGASISNNEIRDLNRGEQAYNPS